MDITLISDLHGFKPELPGGDLLIVAGDLTDRDTREEYLIFGDWIQKQKYRTKIIVCGNHDGRIEKIHNDCKIPDDLGLPKMFINPFTLFGCEYLCDSGTEFDGLKIWGCPWSLTFDELNPHCAAFTGTEANLKKKYDLIPNDIDILISHTPFLHMLDENIDGHHCGSMELRNAVDRVQPRLFVCGHIHEQGGNQMMYKHVGKNTWCVNASYVNENYKPVNKPIRIIL